MKRAVLLGAAPSTARELRALAESLRIRPGRDLLVGVDGGVGAWRMLGILPDLAVGDWDSLERREWLKGIPHVTLAREKDRSDLHHALRAALERGVREIVALGVTGGRADHHLAALWDLGEAAAGGAAGGLERISARDAAGEFHFLAGGLPPWEARLSRGALVSVFAAGGLARGVTLQGLKYPLRDAKLAPSSRGLSNEALGGKVCVRVKKGQLWVVIPAEAGYHS